MDVEVLEVRDWLAATVPFDGLASEALSALARDVSIRYVPRGREVPERDGTARAFSLVRSGAVELRDDEGRAIARRAEGDPVGWLADRPDGEAREAPADAALGSAAVAIEDALLYRVPVERIAALAESDERLARFLGPPGAGPLGAAARETVPRRRAADADAFDLTAIPVSQLLRRSPVSVAPEASIRDAARLMTSAGTSSVLVLDGPELAGIVTDRDLRRRVIVAGRDAAEPVASIMTRAPSTIDARAPAWDALLTMARLGVHHLPVVDATAAGRAIGVVTTSSLVEGRSGSALRLATDIRAAADHEALRRTARRLPELLARLDAAGVSASRRARVIGAMGDAVVLRTLELVRTEADESEPSMAWLACGAAGRQDAVRADGRRDVVLLPPEASRAGREAAGDALEHVVRDVRALADGTRAPGASEACDIEMPGIGSPAAGWPARGVWSVADLDALTAAAGDARSPQGHDGSTVSAWCDVLDLRPVAGDAATIVLATASRDSLRGSLAGSALARAALAERARRRMPPVGFFRDEAFGGALDGATSIDLVDAVLEPAADVARLAALALPEDPLDTVARLEAASGDGGLGTDIAARLAEAVACAAALQVRCEGRARHASCARDGSDGPAAFAVPIAALDTVERRHLIDVFHALRAALDALPSE